MQLRRPLAALLTTLALFGGGTATLTACGDPAGTDRSDGTTDSGENTGGEGDGGLPDNSDPEPENQEDSNDDTQDPD
jgi:hypothetical protein